MNVKIEDHMTQEQMAYSYFVCKPEALDEVCNNTTTLGMQLTKNGYFEQARHAGLDFECLDSFDLFMRPVWKDATGNADDFSLLKTYRVKRASFDEKLEEYTRANEGYAEALAQQGPQSTGKSLSVQGNGTDGEKRKEKDQ